MWSGKFTHHCEGWNNYKGLEKDDPTFLNELHSAGYTSRVFGKTDILSGSHTIRARVSPWTRSSGILKPHYRMEKPEILDRSEIRVHGKDWEDVDRACAWLREAPSPFFLYVGIRAPHPAFRISPDYLDRIDEDGVTVPPMEEENHPVLEYQRTVKNWQHGFSEEAVKTVRRIYFAMIAEVDAMVGEILSALNDTGLNDSTTVLFSSDHGELAMEHRQFYKMSLFEPSVHIPLIVAGPGLRKNAVEDAPVSLVDIYPTLMDLANRAHPEALDGHSLLPELTGGSSSRPDWVLSEFHGTTCPTGAFMLRQDSWKYNVYVGYEPQLFNLEEDPWEISNLAGSHGPRVREMDDLLRSIVDYEAIDSKVKAYDRESFRNWREEQKKAGTYEETIARVYSGWDRLSPEEIVPWTREDEEKIEAWLNA